MQEPSDRHLYRQSRRRHFHHARETAISGGKKIGNDHFSAPPVVLPPNVGREGSFNSLRECRAAGSGLGGRSSVGPSEENRQLRSAQLSRTFDSQILFGSNQGEEEVLGCYQRPGIAAETDNGRPPPPPPPPAGGGRVGRMAEGAAWLPGGRRLVPGSKAFVSHLDNGMMAKKFATVEDNDGASSTTSGSITFSARKSRAAAAARELPVWIPKPDPKSTRPVAAAAAAAADGGGRGYGSARQRMGRVKEGDKSGFDVAARNAFGPVSLGQLMSGGEEPTPGGQTEITQHHKDGKGFPISRFAAPSPTSTATNTAGRDRNLASGKDYDDERYPAQPSVCAVNERGGGGAFDWWGGASASDAGNEFAGDGAVGRVGGGRAFKTRPKTVSDTYKSSLVFG